MLALLSDKGVTEHEVLKRLKRKTVQEITPDDLQIVVEILNKIKHGETSIEAEFKQSGEPAAEDMDAPISKEKLDQWLKLIGEKIKYLEPHEKASVDTGDLSVGDLENLNAEITKRYFADENRATEENEDG